MARMGAREFVEWAAFDAVEPIGQARLDVLAGMIVHAVMAGAGAKGLKLTDCMPKWDWSIPEPVEQRVSRIMQMMAGVAGK